MGVARVRMFSIEGQTELQSNAIQTTNLNQRPANSLAFVVLIVRLLRSSKLKRPLESMAKILRAKNDNRLIIMIALPASAVGNQNDE